MNNFFSYFKRKSVHRWIAILLFTVLAGTGMLGSSGEVYAGGSFDVPKVNDGFNQFEQDSPSQQEQTGSTPSVKEEKGFWDSVTQPFANAWDWTTDKLSGVWKWTKEKASAFADWLTDVLSKITEVVVDALAATWDWIVKFKEYIAFAGVLILGIVLCIFATPLGVAVLTGMALSLLIGAGFNGWKFDKTVFLEAAIGGLLGLIGGGITAGASRGLASGLGQKLITGAAKSKVLGSVLRGGQKLISKLPAPIQKMFSKSGFIGSVEGAGTSVVDDILHNRKINWKNALLAGFFGAVTVGVVSFVLPIIDNKPVLSKIPIIKNIDCFVYSQTPGYYGSIALASPIKCVYGEHITRKNGHKALKSNIEYTTKEGYKYITDEKGRISIVEGTLQSGKGKRNLYAQRTVGGADRLGDDDGGHLIATIFKGSGNIDNLVPMNLNLNRGEWKKLENLWAEELRKRKEIKLNIKPKYKGDSQRPDNFEVKYKIGNDEWILARFKNVLGGR